MFWYISFFRSQSKQRSEYFMYGYRNQIDKQNPTKKKEEEERVVLLWCCCLLSSSSILLLLNHAQYIKYYN